jgi:hypothetical protein
MAAIVGRILRALGARASSTRPFPLVAAQEFLWWRIWARAGMSPEALSLLEPLLEPLGFAPEASLAAAREAAFAALLRVVLEEVRAGHGARGASGEARLLASPSVARRG